MLCFKQTIINYNLKKFICENNITLCVQFNSYTNDSGAPEGSAVTYNNCSCSKHLECKSCINHLSLPNQLFWISEEGLDQMVCCNGDKPVNR
jgi:hypothetical protein